MSEITRPEVPKNPIVEEDGNRDTLDRVAAILDFMMHSDEEAQLSGNGSVGYFWINRMLVDAIRYVGDSLDYEVHKRQQEKRKREKEESSKPTEEPIGE